MKYPSNTLTHLRLSTADDKSYGLIINNMLGEKGLTTDGARKRPGLPQKKTGRDSIKR